jgi:hypothetical protein
MSIATNKQTPKATTAIRELTTKETEQVTGGGSKPHPVLSRIRANIPSLAADKPSVQ